MRPHAGTNARVTVSSKVPYQIDMFWWWLNAIYTCHSTGVAIWLLMYIPFKCQANKCELIFTLTFSCSLRILSAFVRMQVQGAFCYLYLSPLVFKAEWQRQTGKEYLRLKCRGQARRMRSQWRVWHIFIELDICIKCHSNDSSLSSSLLRTCSEKWLFFKLSAPLAYLCEPCIYRSIILFNAWVNVLISNRFICCEIRSRAWRYIVANISFSIFFSVTRPFYVVSLVFIAAYDHYFFLEKSVRVCVEKR